MFPYINIGSNKIYMTGIGIIIAFVCFLVVAFYLCKKYKQDFRKLFYRLPIPLILAYFLGSYVDFALNTSLIPTSKEELMMVLTPYNYSFHFIGILAGFVIGIYIFFKKIIRYESKKLWADIFFYSIVLSLVPLGFFLLLGDNFIGKTTTGPLGVKRLIEDSELRKFSSVYPIGIFISIGSLLLTVIISLIRKRKRQYGYGMLGLAGIILMLNIVFLFQQYPRHGIIPVGPISIDIKQHFSFLIIMLCLLAYNKRNRHS